MAFIDYMTPVRKIRLQVVIILIIAVLGVLFAWPKGPDWIRKEVKLHLGLDLAGGAHLVYQADVSEIPKDQRDSAVAGTRDVIERRVNALGVGEPLVQTNKTETGYRIIVELPGVTDVKDAISRIGDTPVLEFKEMAEPTPLTEEEKQENQAFNDAQKELAEKILEELLFASDDEFAAKATEVSEDIGSQSNGGDLGFIRKGMFVPEFEEVLFNQLEDGEMYNEILESVFGYHIIKRLESQCKDKETDAPIACPSDLLRLEAAIDDTPDFETTISTSDAGLDITIEGKDEESPDDTVIKEVRGRHILLSIKSLEAKPPEDSWKNTQLSGEHLKIARVEFDQKTAMPTVSLDFNKEGADLFEEITERNVGKQVAIFLDGAIISAPRVNAKISGGSAVISGSFSIIDARDLAKRLNAGALPVNITLISQQQVGASLGQESIQKSFLAGILGLILVIIFMIAYYRLPGLVASVALIIYSLIIVTIFKLVPIVLTLSGVAGFILTIGLAVDANVLIFERLKEELRAGKTLQAAIDEGFARAWTSIRDSNISTLITAFILMWLGESLIKGFGITLGIGVLVSMFSAITITRVLLKIIAGQGKEGNWWWGV